MFLVSVKNRFWRERMPKLLNVNCPSNGWSHWSVDTAQKFRFNPKCAVISNLV